MSRSSEGNSHAMHELTDRRFWKDVWKHEVDLSRYDDDSWVTGNYTYRRFHDICRAYLRYDETKTFLDIGCGVGDWSVYFHRTYGYRVTAVDLSAEAVAQAKRNFERQGIDAAVLCEDIFEHKGQYDVIYAGGVIEHFSDPEPILGKMHSLLKAGGVLINWIPNLEGRTGMLYRLFDRSVFDTHAVLKDELLVELHRKLGFEAVDIHYDGSICLNMLPKAKVGTIGRIVVRVLAKIVSRLCLYLRFVFGHIEGRWISPFKVVVARRRA